MTKHAIIPGHDGHERHDDVEVTPTAGETATPGGHNRRKFLAGAGATALAAATVAVTATALPAAAEAVEAVETDGPDTTGETVVAYVSSAARGEITFFRGGHEVVVQDSKLAHALTSRIDQALARTANQER